MNKDKRNIRILVVEDNPGDLLLIEDYLEDHFLSADIEVARSFTEAEAHFSRAEFHPFDVVLLDLSLPDKQGEELISAMIGFCSRCPIIVLTGYSDFDFSIRSLSLGVSDYLLKDELSAFALYKSIIYNIERKKTQIVLAESEKLYSDMFHLNPEPMLLINAQTESILDVNKAAVNQYGYSHREFIAKNWNDLELNPNNHNMVGESSGDLYGSLLTHYTATGEKIYVDVRSGDFNWRGTPAKILLAINVTEKLRYIRAIEDQNQKLGEIAHIQSHVVRAPMARLMGLVQLLESGEDNDFDRSEILDHILDSANELDIVIRDISDRTEKVNPKK